MTSEREHLARAVASLEAPSRELWQPDPEKQFAAGIAVLAESIHPELRSHIHDRLTNLERKAA